jgi:hypothetical protein
MAARLLRAGLAASACLLAAAEAAAQSRLSIYPRESQSIYPRQGCSTTSRINPCATLRVPSPVGNPTAGPLTDSTRRGPLDRPLDPLGIDADLPTMPPEVRSQSLPSQKD